jgi:hypothetical protein
VLVNGVVFVTEYLRVPDEDTAADDVVFETKRGAAATNSVGRTPVHPEWV